jgi:hypothetical protein
MTEGPNADTTPTMLNDVVYGASFETMTIPDQRLAFREGAFDETAAFYPRSGCGDPLPAFSIDAAGGFSAQAAIDATIAGMLPPEDPTTCREDTPEATPAVITPPSDPFQAFEVAETACHEPTEDSSVRWREPDADAPDLTSRRYACVHLATFPGMPASDVIQLVVTGRTDEPCAGLTHYVLKGCREDPSCGVPDWDHSLAPPSWWPCGM